MNCVNGVEHLILLSKIWCQLKAVHLGNTKCYRRTKSLLMELHINNLNESGKEKLFDSPVVIIAFIARRLLRCHMPSVVVAG